MLNGVHFLLSYKCIFECDHCFLYCGPSSTGTFSLRQVRAVLDDLAANTDVESICFEGGEPFLYYPLLLESIRYATAKGFRTAIETNTYWATDEEDAELWLRPLKEAGLTVFEASDDLFHHADEAANSAKRALAAAQRVGLQTSSMCIEAPRAEQSADQNKGDPIYAGGPKLRGRAVETLTEGLPTRPWEELTECPFEDLRDPKRVHVDAYGNVHLCQGLIMGNMWEIPLSEMIAKYDAETHPICGPILQGGPAQLARDLNVEHADEYIDACHLCSKICRSLVDRFPEHLGPRQVYGLEE